MTDVTKEIAAAREAAKAKKREASPAPAFQRLRPEEQPFDAVFFRTLDVTINTKFVYYGRMAWRSEWIVTKILSKRALDTGYRGTDVVQRHADIISLRLADPRRWPWMPKIREATFSYLQGAARWRLAIEKGG